MKFLRYATLVLSLFASAALTSCDDDDDPAKPAQTGKLTLEFDHMVGSSALQLGGTTPYTTSAGDQFKVSTLRYYISNIKLKKADGTEFVQPESYYLVDEALPASKMFTINDVPTGDYTNLTFTIGVDSTRNVSGAQTGALTPTDMFWGWTTGYIFMKLEGRSPQAPNPTGATDGGVLLFHIGGFRKGQNALQAVSPSLNGSTLQVRESRTPQVHLKVDLQKMFTGPTTVRFSQISTIHGPGTNAVNVSRNYANGMFTVDHVHGN